MQKLVRPVCIGMRAEHAGNQELRLRELGAETLKRIVPPSPIHIAGLPKCAGAPTPVYGGFQPRRIGGAFHPSGPRVLEAHASTVGRVAFENRLEIAPRTVGRNRRRQPQRSTSEVFGRSTLPAAACDGSPSAPITERRTPRAVEHERLELNCGGRMVRKETCARCSPSTLAARCACSLRSGGNGLERRMLTTPVAESSTRSRSARAMRKLEGTTPLASPEVRLP